MNQFTCESLSSLRYFVKAKKVSGFWSPRASPHILIFLNFV